MSNSNPISSVKIHGAGSIGNHMAHAARSLGWRVTLCDISEAALERTRNEIYPGRYGQWDEEITLCRSDEVQVGGHDMIIVGTPPDSHMDLALTALEEKPKALLIEKPLCMPGLEGAQALVDASRKSETRLFVGYDHVVGEAAEKAGSVAVSGSLGDIVTMDVEFREHWGGIFGAHPWLAGPGDTYLGYSQRGGGASGEHSHAANLWQSFAYKLGAGRICRVSAAMDFVKDGECSYDRLCLMNVVTENGLVGRVVQDVVTRPPRKWARIQGTDGFVEWHCGYQQGCDAVISDVEGGSGAPDLIQKTRPEDFIRELRHIVDSLAEGSDSPIALERGLDTMLVVAAAHLSVEKNCVVEIDYAAGYGLQALNPL